MSLCTLRTWPIKGSTRKATGASPAVHVVQVHIHTRCVRGTTAGQVPGLEVHVESATELLLVTSFPSLVCLSSLQNEQFGKTGGS